MDNHFGTYDYDQVRAAAWYFLDFNEWISQSSAESVSRRDRAIYARVSVKWFGEYPVRAYSATKREKMQKVLSLVRTMAGLLEKAPDAECARCRPRSRDSGERNAGGGSRTRPPGFELGGSELTTDHEMTRLADIAGNMRKAIDAVPEAELPESMSSFPAGCCHGASILLGTYLADCGEQGFLIICGERGSHEDRTWTSHAWLARGDLIIDIAADQFPDAPASVIVEHNSQWHRSFEWTGSEPSDLRMWGDDAHGLWPLRPFYARLKSLLTQ